MDPVKVSDAGQRWNVDLDLTWDKFQSFITRAIHSIEMVRRSTTRSNALSGLDANANVNTEAVSEGENPVDPCFKQEARW